MPTDETREALKREVASWTGVQHTEVLKGSVFHTCITFKVNPNITLEPVVNADRLGPARIERLDRNTGDPRPLFTYNHIPLSPKGCTTVGNWIFTPNSEKKAQQRINDPNTKSGRKPIVIGMDDWNQKMLRTLPLQYNWSREWLTWYVENYMKPRGLTYKYRNAIDRNPSSHNWLVFWRALPDNKIENVSLGWITVREASNFIVCTVRTGDSLVNWSGADPVHCFRLLDFGLGIRGDLRKEPPNTWPPDPHRPPNVGPGPAGAPGAGDPATGGAQAADDRSATDYFFSRACDTHLAKLNIDVNSGTRPALKAIIEHWATEQHWHRVPDEEIEGADRPDDTRTLFVIPNMPGKTLMLIVPTADNTSDKARIQWQDTHTMDAYTHLPLSPQGCETIGRWIFDKATERTTLQATNDPLGQSNPTVLGMAEWNLALFKTLPVFTTGGLARDWLTWYVVNYIEPRGLTYKFRNVAGDPRCLFFWRTLRGKTVADVNSIGYMAITTDCDVIICNVHVRDSIVAWVGDDPESCFKLLDFGLGVRKSLRNVPPKERPRHITPDEFTVSATAYYTSDSIAGHIDGRIHSKLEPAQIAKLAKEIRKALHDEKKYLVARQDDHTDIEGCVRNVYILTLRDVPQRRLVITLAKDNSLIETCPAEGVTPLCTSQSPQSIEGFNHLLKWVFDEIRDAEDIRKRYDRITSFRITDALSQQYVKVINEFYDEPCRACVNWYRTHYISIRQLIWRCTYIPPTPPSEESHDAGLLLTFWRGITGTSLVDSNFVVLSVRANETAAVILETDGLRTIFVGQDPTVTFKWLDHALGLPHIPPTPAALGALPDPLRPAPAARGPPAAGRGMRDNVDIEHMFTLMHRRVLAMEVAQRRLGGSPRTVAKPRLQCKDPRMEGASHFQHHL